VSRIAGVDGCRGGWAVAAEDPETGARELVLAPRWADLPNDLRLVCVDMPIGLAESGRRGCDGLARALLPRGRKSSVFPAPRRPMLAFERWQDANAWGKRQDGIGLTVYAWGLIAKIRELDAALGPADQARVRESHPELAFNRMSGGTPLPPKRTPAGRAARRQLLEAEGFDALDDWLARYPRSVVQTDDVLDACACLVTARRIVAGDAIRLPDAPLRDARGLAMEIWY
jgi:predicted RNase H-like nuclease